MRVIIKTVAVSAALIHALGIGAGDLSAQAGRAKVEEGNRLYDEGRFAEAHERYLEALSEDPDSPLIRFNDGNALYQSEDFQRAMEAYQWAIESGDARLANAAWYNMGNALYRAEQLEPSLEAYKQALRDDPTDTDAKHNLERVLEQIQEQEEEQQQESDDSDQDDSDQDDSDQEDSDQENPDQDEPDPQDTDPQNQDPQDQDSEEDDPQPGDAQPQESEMSPEEAQRLLDAIEEDPGDVNRKPAAARGRRPRKAW